MTSPVRSVVVRLSMDPAGYIAGASAAGAATTALDREVSRIGPSAATNMERAAASAGKAESSFLSLSGVAGKLGLGVGLLSGVTAAAAVKMAGDYQALVTKLETTAGETTANIGKVSQGMLDMAGQVGESATELAKGMYTVESSGIHGADALVVLKAAAQGAKQEQADLSHVTDAVTTSLHDYHLPASQAADVTSQLIDAVAHGKTTFDELTGAMHSVEPIAASAGMSIAQTAGALAAMTASGMHADQAAQNLASSIRSFEKPTSTMTAELAQLGLNSQDLSANLGEKGIAGTLQEVSDAIVSKMGPAGQVALSALNQNKQAASALVSMMQAMPPELATMSAGLLDGSESITGYTKAAKTLGGESGAMALQFESLYKSSDGFSNILKAGGPAVQTYLGALGKSVGTAEGLSVALQLTGENAATTNQTIADIAATSAQADGNIKGWAEVQANFNQQLSETEARAKSLAIEAGQHLLPVLTDGLTWLNAHGTGILHDLGTGFHDVETVLGPLVTTGEGAVHFFQSLPGPMQDVVLALGALKAVSMLGLFSGVTNAEGQVTGTLGRMGASAATFRETYQLQMALAGEETGTLAASTGALAASFEASMPRASTAVGGFATSVRASMAEVSGAFLEAKTAQQVMTSQMFGGAAVATATGDIAGLGAATRVAATEGVGMLGKGIGGLTTMLGGPFGLALIGGTVAVASITSSMQSLHAAEDQAKTSGDELANTYIKLGTIYGTQADAARETVKQQAGLNDIAQRAGISQDILTQALEGNADAQHKASDAAGGLTDRWNSLKSASLGDLLSGNFLDRDKTLIDSVSTSVSQAATNFGLFNRQTSDAASALASVQGDADKVFGPNSLLNTGVSTLQTGMDELASSSGDTQKSLQGITDILDGLTGKGVSAAQATVDLTTATVDTTKAFAQMTAGALDSSGAVDLTTEAGIGLWNSLTQVSSGFKTAVNDAYNSALATGTATDASKAAGDAAETLYSKFILTATGAGMSQQAAADLAKQLGLVPGDIVTTFTQPGLSAAQAGVSILQGQVDVLTAGPHDVTVRSLTADAEAALTAVDVHVNHLPDGTVHIDADTYAAQSALDNFLIANATHVITVGIAGTNNAAYTGSSVIVNGMVKANADGNLLGMSPMSSSVAQVVHPGTLRVIGDNPVADEAFIPINNSARSLAILGETAARMGLGLTAMASGGFVGISGPWPAGGTSVGLSVDTAALAGSIQGAVAAASAAARASAPGAPTSVSANAALAQRMAAAHGWTGAEWNALYALGQRESGWNNTAQNPTSTAYGIPQFLNSTWATVGLKKTSDPATQIEGMDRYIAQRYGDPIKAWAHETSAGWYHSGGDVVGPAGADVPAVLRVGETVRTRTQEAGVQAQLRTREMAGVGGSSGGGTVKTDARSYPLTVVAGPSTADIIRAARDAQRDQEFLHG